MKDEPHNQKPAGMKELDSSGADGTKSPIAINGYPASGSPSDLTRTEYVVATDGGEFPLIRHTKDSHWSVSADWIRGHLVPAGVCINIRENEITNEMKYHFPWHLAEPLSAEKVDLFINLYRAVTKNLDPNELKICGHSHARGTADYGRFEISAKQNLLEACKEHFSGAEIEELSRFIEAHRDGDGVMTVCMSNLYTIKESRSG